jgi:hypothetical protein
MLHVWSGVAQVTVAVPGPDRLDLYAVRRAGETASVLLVEAYGADGLVVGGELAVWELNQALASLRAGSSQARRLAVRDDGRGHAGYLDLVCDDGTVAVYATSRGDARKTEFRTTSAALANDLGTVLHHYLALTRSGAPHTVVLPDALSPRVPSRR